MRFMAIVKASKDSEAGVMPGPELLETMGRFNQKMIDAGVMIDGAGLRASAHGARVGFDGDKRTVIYGPFAETKELIAGYWLLKAGSLQEAIDWIKRSPPPHDGYCEVEIRPLFEMEDFA